MKENKKILTLRKDPVDERDYKFSKSKIVKEDKILKFQNYTDQMTPVKDQGNLGSCVAFAVTAMKEWQETVENTQEILEGKPDYRKGKVYNLSEQWIYYNCKKIDPWPNEEGTSIRYAMKVLQKIGVPCESAWPYSDVRVGKPEKWADLVARWSIIDSYWRLDNLNDMKQALTTGPVVIGIPVFREFFYPKDNGVIAYPANPSEIYGGHAICVVGYNDKTGKVVFKNSWGTSWGMNGYGKLHYKYIEDFLWDAWACKDVSVTKEMLKGKIELLETKPVKQKKTLRSIFKRKK